MPNRFKEPVSQLFEYLTTTQVLAVSVSFGIVADLINKYVFSDWEFAVFLIVAMLIDTVVGLVKAWNEHNISSMGYARFFTKIIIYFSVLVISHVLTNFLIHGKANGLFTWVEDVFYVALILREGLSILRNIASIYPGLIPRSVLKRFEDFDETGNLE